MPMLNIVSAIFFIIIAWWGLQALNMGGWLRHPESAQAKTLQILLSIVIGYNVSTFFTDYLSWFTMLKNSMISSS